MDKQTPNSKKDLWIGLLSGAIVNFIALLGLSIIWLLFLVVGSETGISPFLSWYLIMWLVIITNILALIIIVIIMRRFAMRFFAGYAISLCSVLIVWGFLVAIIAGIFFVVDCFSNPYY